MKALVRSPLSAWSRHGREIRPVPQTWGVKGAVLKHPSSPTLAPEPLVAQGPSCDPGKAPSTTPFSERVLISKREGGWRGGSLATRMHLLAAVNIRQFPNILHSSHFPSHSPCCSSSYPEVRPRCLLGFCTGSQSQAHLSCVLLTALTGARAGNTMSIWHVEKLRPGQALMPKTDKCGTCCTLWPQTLLFPVLTRLQEDFQVPVQAFSKPLWCFLRASPALCVRAGPHNELGSQASAHPQMP